MMATIRQLPLVACSCLMAFAGCNPPANVAENREHSLLNPHKLPPSGPWFEGWYVRITPTLGTNRSLGVIVGSFLPPKQSSSHAALSGLPGYAAILDGEENGKTFQAREAFPSNTHLFLNHEDSVTRDPSPTGPAAFRWWSDGVGELTATSMVLNLPDGARMNATWRDVVPWNSAGQGPEGVISLLRAFPLHWFVHSLKSRVDFEARLPSTQPGGTLDVIKGSGYAHIEKNWGSAFPSKYLWMQAHDPVLDRTIALAGGSPFKIGSIAPETWLIGYRSEKFSQDFAPQQLGTSFTSRIDACAGRFELTATSLSRRIIVSAQAPRKTFGGIAIPTDAGFQKNGSEQSFQSDISVQLFEFSRLPWASQTGTLLEESHFKSGALEFGAGFKCSPSN